MSKLLQSYASARCIERRQLHCLYVRPDLKIVAHDAEWIAPQSQLYCSHRNDVASWAQLWKKQSDIYQGPWARPSQGHSRSRTNPSSMSTLCRAYPDWLQHRRQFVRRRTKHGLTNSSRSAQDIGESARVRPNRRTIHNTNTVHSYMRIKSLLLITKSAGRNWPSTIF